MSTSTMQRFSFAYVRYLEDNILRIVSLEHVKRFDAETHHNGKVYKVYWPPDMDEDGDVNMTEKKKRKSHKAEILKLSNSLEEMEKMIKDGSRIIFRKRTYLNTDIEETETEDDSPVVKARSAKRALDFTQGNKKESMKKQEQARCKELTKIMDKQKAAKKPLVATTKPGKPPAVSTSSKAAKADPPTNTSFLTSQPPEDDTKQELLRKLRVKTAETNFLKKRVDELTELNFRLQREVLDQIGKRQRTVAPADDCSVTKPKVPTARAVPVRTTPVYATPDVTAPAEPVVTPSTATTPQAENTSGEEDVLYTPVDGKVTLGQGLNITTSQWDILKKQRTNSLYCKTLATLMWGSGTLKERSLFGRACPRHKNVPGKEAKAPLTPAKLDIMRACFRQHLRDKGYRAEELKKELGKMNRFVSEKIQDLNRP